MGDYLFDLKIAVMFFPVAALIVSIPFMLIEYHKYGSVSFFKSVVTYSFVLYLLCAYFLIILPLPEKSEVAKLTTPIVQLEPFNFIIDIIKHFKLSFSFLKTSYVYVPLFNIALTIPFGVYLKYLFKCDLEKTTFYTFLLSAFFEFTQLSGLYFIYSRGYRLCDVDDLILNTLGGFIGYFVAKLITKPLPTLEKLNKDATKKGTEVTGFKRTTSLFLDIFLYFVITALAYIIIDNEYTFVGSLVFYYLIIPIITKGSTLGQKWLNLKIVNNKESWSIIRLFLRFIMFLGLYLSAPISAAYYIAKNFKDVNHIYIIIAFGLMALFYMITAIKYLFTNKPVLYEIISGTKLKSTIKPIENKE